MQSKNIKLIALDIDGTIMDKNFCISKRVEDVVKQAINEGIHVVIATGRMYSATVPIAEKLGLITPLIVYQGSLVQEFKDSDKILLHQVLETKDAFSVIKDLRKYGVQINAYINDKLYVEDQSPIAVEYSEKRNIPLYTVDSFEEFSSFAPTKLLGLDYDISLIDKIKNEMKEKYDGILNITKSTNYFCEFVNKKCSKATSLLFLADKLGVKQSEIMAIGDQNNDEEMLKAAAIGVAMGNGDEKLKAVADFVTKSVSEDGAAYAIEKFVLN